MALIQFTLGGDIADMRSFDVVDNPADSSGATWGQAELTAMDEEPVLIASGGGGTIDSYMGVQEDLKVKGLSLLFNGNGDLSPGFRACYCPDVAKFWDVVVPGED